MRFETGALYHIYNRGNNKQPIFPQVKNYDFFVKKIIELITPCCDILAYCLMPNHFHFLIHANAKSVELVRSTNIQLLSRRLGTLQSSYTRAINIQENSTGTLFQQKYKAIILSNEHAENCFHYIHNNPINANLTVLPEIWPYSSYHEYLNDTDNVCNKPLAVALLQIPANTTEFTQLNTPVISCGKDFLNLSEHE
jgi:putative transposase